MRIAIPCRRIAILRFGIANAAVVKGIVGDTNYGDDSDIYGARGYVRKSERASGLTRKNAKRRESRQSSGREQVSD